MSKFWWTFHRTHNLGYGTDFTSYPNPYATYNIIVVFNKIAWKYVNGIYSALRNIPDVVTSDFPVDFNPPISEYPALN